MSSDKSSRFDISAKKYLLDQLNEYERIEFEALLFKDPDGENSLFIVEDDMICDYLNDKLSSDEKHLFEKKYLNSEDNRQRFLIRKSTIEYFSSVDNELSNHEEEFIDNRTQNRNSSYLPEVEESLNAWIMRLSSNNLGFKLGMTPIGIIFLGSFLCEILIVNGIYPVNVSRLVLSCSLQSILSFSMFAYVKFGFKPTYYPQYAKSSLAVKQFWEWWAYVLLSWGGLFGALAIAESFSKGGGTLFYHISVFMNNGNTLLLFVCYYILKEETVDGALTTEYSVHNNKTSMEKTKHLAPTLIPYRDYAGITAIAEEKKLTKERWFISVVLVIVLFSLSKILVDEFLYKDVSQKILDGMNLVSGLVGAVILALFISCFASKYMNVSVYARAFLFFYVGAQLVSVYLFNENNKFLDERIVNLLIWSFLIGKIYLFILIQWLVYSNRLLYYMLSIGVLNKFGDVFQNHFLKSLQNEQ